MKGTDLLEALKCSLEAGSDSELREKLGVSQATLRTWRNARELTAKQLAGIVKRARVAAHNEVQREAVRPIVEFFPIESCESSRGARYELFTDEKPNGTQHRYLSGLKLELRTHYGVYIFFDSRGQAIYVGKARKQTLWHEMTNAFNRARGSVQKIKRVNHPFRDQTYRTSDEKARQITDQVVPISELASYFSAYAVADVMIDDIESLLVRSFANDLLNKRMERFGRYRFA